MTKIRVRKYVRSAGSTEVGGFIKKHPHHKLVRATRRKARHAGVSGYLREKA